MAATSAFRLGWIGLGSMGLAMAKNLQAHLANKPSAPLHFTNRTMSRGAPLEALGGVPCQSIAEVIRNSDIVFVSLSDDAALASIVEQVLNIGDLTGKIFVDTTTVNPETTAAVGKKLTEAGAAFVAAPVFGATPVAEAGQLLFVVAGPSRATETIATYLKDVMGRDALQLGEEPAKASLMKTSGNFITAAMMEVIAEAHVFAEKSDLGRDMMEKLIEFNYGALALSMSKRLTTGAYMPATDERPMSDLDLALKDVGHGITCARNVGTTLKVGETVLAHLQRAKIYSDEHGGRPLDSSSMYGVIRSDAGLDFETDAVKKRDEGK